MQDGVEDPVCRPMSKLCVVNFLSTGLREEKERLIRWVEEVAEDVHCDQ